MTRTLSITATEWANVIDGRLWLVREPRATSSRVLLAGARPNLRPPEFVQACAPCEPSAPWFERQHPGCNYLPGHFSGGALYCNKCGWGGRCPDCRIELVGPCPHCAFDYLGPGLDAKCQDGMLTLGYAYPVGQPRQTDDGQWTIELVVQP